MGAVGHSKSKIEVSLLYPLKEVLRLTGSPSCLDPFWVSVPGQESNNQVCLEKKGKRKRKRREGKMELDTFHGFIISCASSNFCNAENAFRRLWNPIISILHETSVQ